jgi:hypothetical protein
MLFESKCVVDELLLSIRQRAIIELIYSRKQRVLRSLSHSQVVGQKHPAGGVRSMNDLITRTNTLLSSPALTYAFFLWSDTMAAPRN